MEELIDFILVDPNKVLEIVMEMEKKLPNTSFTIKVKKYTNTMRMISECGW